MAYFVEFVEQVLEYVDQVNGLTDAARQAIVDGIIQELSQDADRFFALYPVAHESLSFKYDHPYLHEGKVCDFDFVVNASHLEMGIVRVAYVECTVLPPD